MKKINSLLLTVVVSLSMLSVLTLGYGWITGELYTVSDGTEVWTQTIDSDTGFPIPSDDWKPSVSAWRHPTWKRVDRINDFYNICLLYTSPSPRDRS